MGSLYYVTTDGENDPDVEVCPFPLRGEGNNTDRIIFNPDFQFSLVQFLEKLEDLVEMPVGPESLDITYEAEGLTISVLDVNDVWKSIWISILREPPKGIVAQGTLTNAGNVIYDHHMPQEN